MGKKSQGKQRYLVQAVSPEGVKLGSCTTACFKEHKLLFIYMANKSINKAGYTAINHVRLGRGSNAPKLTKTLFLQKRDQWTNGPMDRWIDGLTDRRTNGPTDQ